MRTLAAIAIVALTLGTAASAQTTNVTGKWTGTMTRVGADGGGNIEFNLVQKGKVLTGTAGPDAERQLAIEKAVINGSKFSFEVQQPNGGPRFTFTLTLAKEHIVGDMVGVQGTDKREFKVDLTKAAAPKAK
jgi:hypothetical protein